ncbi:TM2 domain-containing protein [Mycetocola saprophilus]|uniref:TM2 domain-containing protein n=1 Tax=Mycetocola saprophilus TaxID=76636 RepID=UPI00068CC81F|nr:TM2 domain-containing protein [Mycetocola saprophilus]
MSTTDPTGADHTAQPQDAAPETSAAASEIPADTDPSRALPHFPAPLTGQVPTNPAPAAGYPAAPGTPGYGQQGTAGAYPQQGAPGAPSGYPQQGASGYPAGYAPYDPAAKSRLTAGLLGIFLGSIGVHRFYLGYIGIGLLQIAATIVTFGTAALWGLIEGIMILARARAFNNDAEGRPLRD